MLIQNLILRKGNNALQEAGDLDGQIAHDLGDLLSRLEAYQTEHLDKKVKGRSNHYEQWSAENAAKIAYVRRLLEMAGTAGKPRAPERFAQEEWDALRPEFRHPAVLAMAARAVENVRQGYLPETVYVEKQSFHPEDWYLWSVAACREYGNGRAWDCWTLNLTTGGMNGGHYGLSLEGLRNALAAKKGARLCRPNDCPKPDEDEEEPTNGT